MGHAKQFQVALLCIIQMNSKPSNTSRFQMKVRHHGEIKGSKGSSPMLVL